jgi:RAQPRD family integrative conjugative element protein
MAHSFRSGRVRHGALIVSLLAIAGAPLSAWADAPMQRQELAAALRQLQALERLIETSAVSTPIEPGQRYHFDYPRLLADLARVKAGLQDYLTPARAQPRDPAELAGQYRRESTDETVAQKPGHP